MRNNVLKLLGLMALGLALRFLILSVRGSLWFDEAFVAHFSAMDIQTMLKYLRFENNPPFYFLIMHFWIKLFNNSDLVLRSFSMIAGIISLPLIYLLGKKIYSSTAGFFATFLATISTLLAFYSTETRMYSLYLLITLITVLFFLKCYTPGSSCKKRYYVFFCASLVTLLWTHITAGMIVLAMIFYVFWSEHFKIKQFILNQKAFIITTTVAVLSFLPWIINFINIKFAAPLSQGYFFYLPPDRNYFPAILESFLVFGQENPFIITLLCLAIVVLLWQTFHAFKNSSNNLSKLSSRGPAYFLLFWLGIPLGIGFAFSNAVPRYFISIAPAFYLLLGIGFAQTLESLKAHFTSKQLRLLPFVFYALTFAMILPDYPNLIQAARYDWKGIAKYVEKQEQPGDLILINPHSEILPFERYYKGTLETIGFYPRQDNNDRDTRIVKTNWTSLNTKQNIRVLADITKDFKRVFLVSGSVIEPVGRAIVPTWFWENNWKRVQEQEFSQMSILLLER